MGDIMYIIAKIERKKKESRENKQIIWIYFFNITSQIIFLRKKKRMPASHRSFEFKIVFKKFLKQKTLFKEGS